MIFTNSIITDFIGVLVALVLIFITYFKWTYLYWKRRNVPYLEPTIPQGNTFSGNNGRVGMETRHFYEEMKNKGWKHGGIYKLYTPFYFVLDLEYLKNILTKDFHHFTDRGMYYNEKKDPLSAQLFFLGGTKWKNLRMKLTPTFTSGKMKMMFNILLQVEANLQEKIEEEQKKNEPLNIKEIFACYTTDVIGSCAFGLNCNSFQKEESLFRTYGKKVFSTSRWRGMQLLLRSIFPELASFLNIQQFPKDVTAFFSKVVIDTIEYREKNNVTRKDFLQLLIDLKNNKLAEEEGYKHDGRTLTIDEIIAQCFLFFLAGFETSSTAMSFALYELAKNQEAQDKAREEVNRVLAQHDGKITYDAIQDMKYLNQVLLEALRMYPPVQFITRQCVKDYKIPDQDIVIEKGTKVMIPIIGIHYDKEYYPDPEKFDPDRFDEENSKMRHQYAHIPFGEGPRVCIGLRFGLMQSKVGLSSLLRKYKFEVNQKTTEPLKFRKSFLPNVEGDIWLDVSKI